MIFLAGFGEPNPLPLFAGAVFLDRADERVLLHLRDAAAPKNPGQWGLLGGTAEDGESAFDCLRRELIEEIELALSPDDATPFRAYVSPRSGRERHVFLVERVIDPRTTPLHEGTAIEWFALDDALALDLTAGTRPDLEHLREVLGTRPRAGDAR